MATSRKHDSIYHSRFYNRIDPPLTPPTYWTGPRILFVTLFVTGTTILYIKWAQAETPIPIVDGVQPVILLDEPINLFDPLPRYVQLAPPKFRRKWIMAHNDIERAKAERRAVAWALSHPPNQTYSQSTAYQTNNSLRQGGYSSFLGNHRLSADAATTYQGTNTQRTFTETRWGGGPVVIINPYTTQEPLP